MKTKLGGAALGLSLGLLLGLPAAAYGQVPSASGGITLPEPLPPRVQRAPVLETLPVQRYYFDPPSARPHYGLRVAVGGGAQWPSENLDDPGATFHLDVTFAGRTPRRLARRRFSSYWQTAIWNNVGYTYSYSIADGNARHFFIAGVGVGSHLLSSKPRAPDPNAVRGQPDQRATVFAIGWTPNILLGRSLGAFAIGIRNVVSLELVQHTIGLHLSYDFIHLAQGTYIHDAAVLVSFDFMGLVRL